MGFAQSKICSHRKPLFPHLPIEMVQVLLKTLPLSQLVDACSAPIPPPDAGSIPNILVSRC